MMQVLEGWTIKVSDPKSTFCESFQPQKISTSLWNFCPVMTSQYLKSGVVSKVNSEKNSFCQLAKPYSFYRGQKPLQNDGLRIGHLK